jgi:polynucleotide 5'-kinase involved in rRNA processing
MAQVYDLKNTTNYLWKIQQEQYHFEVIDTDGWII